MDQSCSKEIHVFSTHQAAFPIEFSQHREEQELFVIMDRFAKIIEYVLDELVEFLGLPEMQPRYFKTVLNFKVPVLQFFANCVALIDQVINVLLLIRQTQVRVPHSARQFALDGTQHPQVVVQFSELFLGFAVVVEGFPVKLQHEVIVCTYLETPILFLLLDRLGIKFVLHSVKHNGPIRLILLLGLSDEVADLRLHDSEAVVEPGLDEVCKLRVCHIGVLDNILSFDQIFANGRTHIQNTYHFVTVLDFDTAEHLLNLFLIPRLVDHPNRESDLVDYLELRPIVVEVFRRKVELLGAALPRHQDIGMGVLLQSGVSFINGEFEVLVAKLADFLL